MDVINWVENKLSGVWLAVLLAVLILVSLSLGLSGEFHRSDKQITQNPFVTGKGIGKPILSPFLAQKGTVGLDHYRPITVESLRWNYAEKAGTPLSYRLLNALIHLGAAWMLFQVIRLWSGNRLLAILSSLLFALHPLTVSSALSVQGREEMLFVFLGFLTWYLHLRRMDPSQGESTYRDVCGISLVFLLALLAHEKALVFFFLILLGDWLHADRREEGHPWGKTRFLSHYMGMFVSFIVYAVWKYVFIGVRPSSLTGRLEAIDNSLGNKDFFASLAGGLKLGATYVLQLFSSLRPRGTMYDFIPPVTWTELGLLLSFLFWLILAAILFLMSRKRLPVLLPLGSMVLCVLPLLNWTHPTAYAFSSLYMYLPAFAAALLLAYGLCALAGPAKQYPFRPLLAGAGLMLLFLLLNLLYSHERKTEIGWLETLNQSDPGSIKVAVGLSDLLRENKREKEALPLMEKMIALRSDFSLAQSEYARSLANADRMDEALQILEKIKQNPDPMGNTFLVEGSIHEVRQNLDKALAAYETGMKFEPRSIRLLNAAGSVYAAMGKFDQATSCFQKALQRNPGAALAVLNLGIVEESQQRPFAAQKYYEQAIRLEPQLLIAYLKLGDLAGMTGQNEASLQIYRQAVELYPDVLAPVLQLGNACIRQKKYEEALKAFQEGLVHFPQSSELLLGAANTYREAEDYIHAEEIYKKLLAADPKNLNAQMAHCLMYYRKQDFVMALDCYQKVIPLDPTNASIYFNIGNVYLNRQQLPLAAESYKKAIELSPDMAQVYMNLGRVCAEMGNTEEAIRYYEEFKKRWKGNPLMLDSVNDLLQKLRQPAPPPVKKEKEKI